jgi:hypothetical protein
MACLQLPQNKSGAKVEFNVKDSKSGFKLYPQKIDRKYCEIILECYQKRADRACFSQKKQFTGNPDLTSEKPHDSPVSRVT